MLSSTQKNIIFYVIIFVVIISLIAAAATALVKSPYWKYLKDIFGALDSASKAISEQLNTCSKYGWFAVNKGCALGIGAIGVGIVFIFLSIAKIFVASRGSVVGETAKAESGKSGMEIIDELNVDKIIDVVNDVVDKTNSEIDQQVKDGKLTEEQGNAMKQINERAGDKAIIEGVRRKTVDFTKNAINEQGLSPQEVQQKIDVAINEYKAEVSEARKETSEEPDGEKVNDAEDNILEDPKVQNEIPSPIE